MLVGHLRGAPYRAPDGTSRLVLDPGSAEGNDGALDGSIVVAVMPARGEVTQLSHVGEWDFDKYEVSCICRPGCRSE